MSIERKSKRIDILRRSVKYLKWRDEVFKRDNYICRVCHESKIELQAHHIIPIKKDESKIFCVDNGLTLCIECHGKIHGIRYTQLIPKKHCEFCDKIFEIKDGQRGRRFCSRDCHYAWRSTVPGGKKGKHYPHLCKKRETKTCLWCGVEFPAPPHKKRGKYCSKECFIKSGSLTRWKKKQTGRTATKE